MSFLKPEGADISDQRFTICPAPTTPSLLTSAAAAAIAELPLKQCRYVLAAIWLDGRVTRESKDMMVRVQNPYATNVSTRSLIKSSLYSHLHFHVDVELASARHSAKIVRTRVVGNELTS